MERGSLTNNMVLEAEGRNDVSWHFPVDSGLVLGFDGAPAGAGGFLDQGQETAGFPPTCPGRGRPWQREGERGCFSSEVMYPSPGAAWVGHCHSLCI